MKNHTNMNNHSTEKKVGGKPADILNQLTLFELITKGYELAKEVSNVSYLSPEKILMKAIANQLYASEFSLDSVKAMLIEKKLYTQYVIDRINFFNPDLQKMIRNLLDEKKNIALCKRDLFVFMILIQLYEHTNNEVEPRLLFQFVPDSLKTLDIKEGLYALWRAGFLELSANRKIYLITNYKPIRSRL